MPVVQREISAWLMLHRFSKQLRFILLGLLCYLPLSSFAAGLIISPAKEAMPLIQQAFPQADKISEKTGELAIRYVYQGETLLGYAFETDDIARIPAYSGEPVNTLVNMDTQGKILGAQVLEHHEPILLVGIPEQKLFDFTDQYQNLSAGTTVKIGSGQNPQVTHLDGLSGATVTVMVMNMAIMRAANKVAQAEGIIKVDPKSLQPPATINPEANQISDWQSLLGSGAIRRLHLKNADVDQAFAESDAADQNNPDPQVQQESFVDLYFTLLNIPSIGKSLLGENEYAWLMSELKPGEHAIALMGNGYSFKGSGYVRGGIFDRIVIHQGDLEFSFRDTEHYRINDLYAEGVPHFSEMSLFIVSEHHQFDPGQSWQVELLVRRQTGPIESVFTSFKADYIPLEAHLIRPEPVVEEQDIPLWKQVWQSRSLETGILIASMLLLTLMLFMQDWLVQFPRFMHRFRLGFLVFTVIFIGWVCKGQLSVVNVLTFVQAFMNEFHWETFLLDPIIFVLWVFVAVAILLWGRGVYCGWLCPFGALQELLGELAVKLRIPQFTMPFAVHERLWAIKYLILLALFGLSLESLQLAEQYAEVEPFKTTFLLNFDRSWPFVTYVIVLLVIALFNRKLYCRYICPLGAAIAIPSAARLFDWLKRRKECGKPCQVCANECEIGAITPTGEINMRECHYCLDCQMTYHNKEKCPPLIKKYKRHAKVSPAEVKAEPIKIL